VDIDNGRERGTKTAPHEHKKNARQVENDPYLEFSLPHSCPAWERNLPPEALCLPAAAISLYTLGERKETRYRQ
jgi:hypothetical protein